MNFHAFIPVIPTPKGRPRMTRSGHTYTPKKTKDTEKEIAEYVRYSADCPSEATDEPVSVYLTFFMPIPKSSSKRLREELLGDCHTKQKDVDNMAKLVLDALNGIIYEDDKQVWYLSAKKVWGDKGKIEIQITD